MKKRIDYIDTAKGFAIIAVVLSHALTNSNEVLNVDHPALLNFLSFFNVSTFFFINGYFYSETCVEFPCKAILKKIKSYYLPFVLYNLFFLAIQNSLVRAHMLDSKYRITDIRVLLISLIQVIFGKMQPLGGAMWFLRALVLLSIMYILTDSISFRIANGKYRYIINGIVALVLTFVSKLSITPRNFNFHQACGAFILYYFGVVYRKYNLNTYIKKYLIPISITTLVISMIIGKTVMVGISGGINPFLDFVSMWVSLIMVLSISQLGFVTKSKVLKYLGSCSMEIMALHFLAFKPISALFISVYKLTISYLSDIPVVKLTGQPGIWPVLYTLSGIALPTLFFYIKKIIETKISHTNR